MSDAALTALATRAGLLVEWRDFSNAPQTVAPDTLRAALAAMGLPAGSAAEIADSERLLSETVGTPSLISGDVHQPCPVDMDGPARLVLEDGRAFDVDPRQLVIHDTGYHTLHVGNAAITLAIAPPRAPSVWELTGRGKAWGSAVQLYSLRTADRAFGDFGALRDFATAAARAGADALAVSPAHALFSADPGRYSPYSPSSRDFLNILYADPGGAERSGPELIDWPEAAQARLSRLREKFEKFGQDPTFESFLTEGGKPLESHALFETIDHQNRKLGGNSGWQGWPAAFHDPASPEVAAFAADHAQDVRYHLWLQWMADKGLADAQRAARDGGMKIGLISDLAVGLDTGGSHAWSRRDELIHGLTIGAPPDFFQPGGQGWGITGFSPVSLRARAFEPYLRTLRTALRHAGGVRIDHALGLGRLWVIPDGARPLDGVYMRYPIDDMLRLLALEASRANALVIGEDLGVVPEGFRDRLADRHLLGMAILPFERGQDGSFDDPYRYRPVAAAMTSTHDVTPMAGWWREVDLDWREKLGSAVESRDERVRDRAHFWQRAIWSGVATGPEPQEPQAAVDAAVALCAVSACELAIIPAEDLFGLEEAPNIPGTIDEHPNWRRRYPVDADTAFATPAVQNRTATLREKRP